MNREVGIGSPVDHSCPVKIHKEQYNWAIYNKYSYVNKNTLQNNNKTKHQFKLIKCNKT